jgi:hypothetical protein
MEELSNLDAIVRHLFDGTRSHKYDNVYDSRLQDIAFSLGQALLTETGIVRDPAYTPENAEDVHGDFRRRFRQYHGTQETNKDQREEHAAQEKTIFKNFLANAAVVVCTVCSPGSGRLLSPTGGQTARIYQNTTTIAQKLQIAGSVAGEEITVDYGEHFFGPD